MPLVPDGGEIQRDGAAGLGVMDDLVTDEQACGELGPRLGVGWQGAKDGITAPEMAGEHRKEGDRGVAVGIEPDLGEPVDRAVGIEAHGEAAVGGGDGSIAEEGEPWPGGDEIDHGQQGGMCPAGREEVVQGGGDSGLKVVVMEAVEQW